MYLLGHAAIGVFPNRHFQLPASKLRSYNFRGMTGEHISDDDLERYCLRRIKDGAELAQLEEHLLAMPHLC